MKQYTRNQTTVKALSVNDSPEIRAAVNLVCAVERGQVPPVDTLKVLADSFLKIFGGQHPSEIYGYPLGLVPLRGRPASSGFTPADIVSAVIELELRRLGKVKGSLARAINHAETAFIDIPRQDSQRSIKRDWAQGKYIVESMSDAELLDLVKPYEVV